MLLNKASGGEAREFVKSRCGIVVPERTVRNWEGMLKQNVNWTGAKGGSSSTVNRALRRRADERLKLMIMQIRA